MRIQVRFRGVQVEQEAEWRIHSRVAAQFTRPDAHIDTITVRIGREHRTDIVCQMSMRVRPDDQYVEVEARHPDLLEAVDHAANKLVAAADRILNRRRSYRSPRSLAPLAEELAPLADAWTAASVPSPGRYRMARPSAR